MPYIVSLVSRSIVKISQAPGRPSDWFSINVDARRFRENSWEYFPLWALLNKETSEIIVEKFEEAIDIEHYTRENEFKWTPGPPSPVLF
jgi:hypothetical protein